MKVHLLGVRGSISASGEAFVRTGGHTSCVALELGPDDAPSWIVLDAGSGFRGLRALLGGEPLRADVLLTHLHWDHMLGLPFLPNADHPGSEVAVWAPRQGDRSTYEHLRTVMSPPAFPIEPGELRGAWSFHEADPGPVAVGASGARVIAAEIRHKGGRTFGYRVDAEGGSIAYLPDHAPATAGPDERAAAVELARGADLLLHDAQFLEPERHLADAFGHATVADAIALASEAGVGALVLVHHAPDRTDDQLADVLAAHAHGPVTVLVGAEGDRLELPGDRR